MKAIFKNKIFLASAAAVMVAAIAVTSILLIPRTEATDNGNGSTPAGDTSSAAPADLDVAGTDSTASSQPDDGATLPPEANEPELTIPVDEKNPDEEKPATAEPGKVEAGSKDKPGDAVVPKDKTESGSKPAGQQKEDGASAAGDAQGKDDYTPKPGDEPHYGVDDNPPPPNNIDEIPDTEPDDTPGNTEGGGEPGDGVKF